MNFYNKYFIFLIIISNFFSLSSQEVEPIQPDRPGLGESAQIVPLNNFQFETGGNYEFDGENENRSVNIIWNNLTLRWGIFKEFELRFATSIEQGIVGTGINLNKSKIGFAPFLYRF